VNGYPVILCREVNAVHITGSYYIGSPTNAILKVVLDRAIAYGRSALIDPVSGSSFGVNRPNSSVLSVATPSRTWALSLDAIALGFSGGLALLPG
jgi:hypothetical protein